MNTQPQNFQDFKKKLEEEQKKLTEELESIGRINPKNPADWEATQTDLNAMASDKNEMADVMEEYEENTAILKQLEIQYNDVLSALKRIENGTYGLCQADIGEKHKISIERLTVLPTAKTCMEHTSSN